MRKPATQPTSTSALQTVMRIFQNACCIFAGCSLALILIQWAISGSIDDAIIAVESFLLLYPLSLGISAANIARRSQGLSRAAKCILHPVLCLGGIFLAYLPYMTKNAFPAGTVMVHLFAFAVAYGIGTTAACLISMALKGREGKAPRNAGGRAGKEPEVYTPVFKKKDEE